MRVDPRKLQRNIESVVESLLKLGLIYQFNSHEVVKAKRGRSRVTWKSSGAALTDSKFGSLSQYIEMVEKGNYSFILKDGSVFQISYDVQRYQIVGHRLAWFPAPVVISEPELHEFGIVNAIIQKFDACAFEDFVMGAAIRFDFAPDQADVSHSQCHLHMYSDECRIPVKSALCPKSFLGFIFKNFYDDAIPHRVLSNAMLWRDTDRLTNEERKLMHLYRSQ